MTGSHVWSLADRPLGPIMALMEAGFPPDYGERWSVTQLSDLLRSDPSSWLSVDDPHGPTGFSLARVAGDEAELMLLTVHPDARRRGVAGALVRSVVDEAVERGADRLFAEVRVGNEAQQFYERIGFQIVGRRPRYYRRIDGTAHDALTMQLRLAKTISDD